MRLRLSTTASLPRPTGAVETPSGLRADADASACLQALARSASCEVTVRLSAAGEGAFLVHVAIGSARHEIALAAAAPAA